MSRPKIIIHNHYSKPARDEEKGVKIPMPTDPKERAEYEAAIARRKARGGGKFVGDPSKDTRRSR
jgi:hypothetical protein